MKVEDIWSLGSFAGLLEAVAGGFGAVIIGVCSADEVDYGVFDG
jgi:hypothetical protein